MKKIFALLLALSMVFALCACGGSSAPAATEAPAAPADDAAAPADDAAPAPVSAKLTMGTGGEAGTYYAFGGVLGSYIGSNTDVSINVVSSGGSAANITGIVVDGIYDLATVQSDVMTYAYNGTNSFTDNKMDAFRSSPATPTSAPLPTSRARTSAWATLAPAPTSTPLTFSPLTT